MFALHLLLLWFVPLSLAGSEKRPEQAVILVMGKGMIISGNVAMAKEAAISDALLKGVEAYLTRRLPGDTLVNNFSSLVLDVIPRAREMTENFHILAQDKSEKYYRVLVRLKVNERLMEERLTAMGLPLIEAPPVKILFLVSQSEPKNENISYWWKDSRESSMITPTDLVLNRVFQETGFSPINRTLSLPEQDISANMKSLNLSLDSAVRWGRLFDADVVIEGLCTASGGKRVTVSLTAIEVGTGAIIGTDSAAEKLDEGLSSMQEMMEPLERAIKRVALSLGPAIVRMAEAPKTRMNRIEVTLDGIRNFKELRVFEDFLKKDVEGVQSVRESRIAGRTVSLLVDFMGDSDALFRSLSNHESFPFPAELGQAEKGNIVIDLH
jgi:hypothetical protein